MADYILNLLPVTEEEKARFAALAPQAEHIYTGRRTVTAEQLARATVMFGWPRPDSLRDAKQLKWFQSMWAGTDEYAGCLPEGAVLTSSSGSNSRSVAEHAFASLLALCRRLPTYRDSQRAHRWEDEGAMKTLLGSTVLVVGAGHIGGAFAQMCQALGSTTIGLKRTVRGPLPGFDRLETMDRLDDLLPQADVVYLSLPHTAQTAGLMNETRLRALKDDAILVNSGRGSVLDQAALVRVMGEGKLWGAALDVTDPEPLPADHPLWDIPNLLLTPHVAGGMRLELTRTRCVEMALENLARYLKGEPLENLVD